MSNFFSPRPRLCAAALAACVLLLHPLRAIAADPGEPAAPDPAQHAGHDMSSMPSGDGMQMPMTMPSAFGAYPMSRDASGTSWQPDATTMGGLHVHGDPWQLMVHGLVNVIHDEQTGPRGARESLSQSMLMLMAQRPLGAGTLGLRSMLSLDPTMGPRGYPLLLQSGETADGKTPLVDRQHPHDLFMELSASYAMPLGADSSAYLYAGLPGEPALGPPAFMHRYSAMRNPEAPLTHHWLDSTHITFGVVTVGASHDAFKLEGSWFNGREPDQHRWNIETRRFDSWSTRLSWNPLPQLSAQVSYGYLKSPEQLEPDVSTRRTTASTTLHLRPSGHDWATTLAWGRNDKRGDGLRRSLPGWLLESTVVVGRLTVFGRAEQVDNDELLAGTSLAGTVLRSRKLELGTIFDVARFGASTWGLGASLARFDVPEAARPIYGAHPHSLLLFLQGRI